ncbi:hypothetical protein CWI38_0845p0020 [Hamiltosporidium tvaerminnensis]|uniref:Uncharacterized protein n=1 Tax=Hamiltosporidium tvaerminnensis TaxID=1176355 RepID=A0A4Q9LWL0_9MICR|nr:hypothetical protein CWI38_0845p0020 [Hamiltosporidium tvaerminnensis]
MNLLNEKRDRLVKRVEETIKTTNQLLSSINYNIEEIVEQNVILVDLSESYKNWYFKLNNYKLEISMNLETYIQSIVLKKTVETISFDQRRGLSSMDVIMRADMHEESKHPLKQANREEKDNKYFKTRNNTLAISNGGTQPEEPRYI